MINGGWFLTFVSHRNRLSIFAWVMAFCWVLSGCAGLQPVPGKKVISPEAEKLLGRLSSQTAPPTHLKGFGRYRLKSSEGKFSGRMAWAIVQPDLFRAEILDITGRPFTTLANDGQWLYVHLKTENQFYKKFSTQATFKRVIGAPVTVKDIIAFLSGRIPIHAYQTAQVRPGGDGPGEAAGSILVLKAKWNRRVEEIHFDKDTLSPRQVVFYGGSGAFSYQVDIGEPFDWKGYPFFRDLSFQNRHGNGLMISLDRLWPDVELSPSIFKLLNPYP